MCSSLSLFFFFFFFLFLGVVIIIDGNDMVVNVSSQTWDCT